MFHVIKDFFGVYKKGFQSVSKRNTAKHFTYVGKIIFHFSLRHLSHSGRFSGSENVLTLNFVFDSNI